jgi:hypothetical protein
VLAAGCDNGGDSEGDNGGYETEDLPASVGANAVGGKTYESDNKKIEFSVAADEASSGTYKVLSYIGGGEYQESKNGAYSWSETTKTITLKPEKVAAYLRGFGGEYGLLEYKTAYRVSLQAKLNNMKKQIEEEVFNQYLSNLYGFSSDDAYLDYMAADEFANKTYNYDFRWGGAALSLYQVLPANKGSNELSEQTYNGMKYKDANIIKDHGQVYTFTYDSYTYTDMEYPADNSSGTYVYDSVSKRVWLKYFSAAYQTYMVNQYRYNTTDKTIILIP